MRRGKQRRWFAAPLVVTTVAAPAAAALTGCGGGTRGPDWNFGRSGTACLAEVPMHCPRGASCNPPPPRAVECPAEMGSADRADMWQATDGSCTLAVAGAGAAAKAAQCPDWNAPVVTLLWTLSPADGGKCTAHPQPRTPSFGPLYPAVTIDCPVPGGTGVIMRASADGKCSACATAPCDATAPTVACPPDQPPQ
jgi:hypothetical protein